MQFSYRTFALLLLLLILASFGAGCITYVPGPEIPTSTPEETPMPTQEITAIPTPTPTPLPTTAWGMLRSEFSWTYQNTNHTYYIDVPKSVYQYFQKQDHTKNSNYVRYALSDYDRTYIKEIADAFTAMGAKAGYSEKETIENFIAFVQSLPYTSDSETTEIEEYPRYPLETLVDKGGDCEDVAILIASVLHEMGHETVLFKLPEHMAVGIAGDDMFSGTYYLYNGTRYYYQETTAKGWSIGDLPEEFADVTVEVLPLEQHPVMNFEFMAEPDTSTWDTAVYRMVATAENLGPGTSHDVRLEVTVRVGGKVYDSQIFFLDDCREHDTVTLTGKINLPRREQAEIVAILTGGNLHGDVIAETGVFNAP
ncbi:transglutaminase-like domain-containing protein [Methanorbis furvi]|uniref:Transglutaminase-like domain-containing protein n=1 Tax=Methanorbis furvi TaxID=3028299 RepID=A0AAE4SAN9_9EURY|nr:hypothetical protein [Methanocorpusculaceae archaeon Ag1]